MFKSWSLKSKIMFSFTAMALGLLIVGAIGMMTLLKVTDLYTVIARQDVPNLVNVDEMRSSTLTIRIHVNRIRLALLMNDPNYQKTLEESQKGIEKEIASYDLNSKEYETRPSRDAEEKDFKDTVGLWQNVLKDTASLNEIANSDHPDAKKFEDLFSKEFKNSNQALVEKLAELANDHKVGATQAANEAESIATNGNRLSLTTVVVGFVLAHVSGLFFASWLANTLNSLSSRLRVGADSVADESQKIAASSSQLSASTTEQAAALQETVSSVDEVSAMINKNADNAKQSQEVANQSEESASKGSAAVSGLINSIDEISRSNGEIMGQIEESNRQMGEIVKVVAEIGSKTKVINDIVFQTKLLSFNASVEAARAGEHGKGFAVVAEEVGNLAAMSGNAAKEISEMLEESSHRVESIVQQTKSKIEHLVVVGREKLADGTSRARSCGDLLQEIVGNVTQVGQLMTEIATASTEQSQGVQEITRAMSQLDQVTQQNAVASQDSANASEQLSEQAEELRSIIEELNATVSGSHAVAKDRKPVEKKRRGSAEKSAGRTLEFKASSKKQTAAKHSSAPGFKKAAGDFDVPSDNDPRFEDV